MSDSPRFYVTTPIYYVNDRPHLGHVYTTTLADILARHHRLLGDDTFFLTGTDEHASKVVDTAALRGMGTRQWADQNAAAFQQTFAKLGLSNDDFIRTSEDRHKAKVREYTAALIASGDVYLGDYEGWYDAGQEEYIKDSDAEKQGHKSLFNGKPLVRKKEKNYFFRLSKYQGELLALLERGEAVDGCRFGVQPTARRNEVVARIKEGLNDVPVSRGGAGEWGIQIPGDEQHVIYVWIDALFNYLSVVDTPDRRRFWPADVHLIAKDILWFHAVIWPALLLALRRQPGYGWVALPQLVYTHSFWISEGMKMSKTLGNFVDLEKIDHYAATFSLDALRYFLASHGPMGTTDSDFAEVKFADAYNADLANTLGNCLSRVSNMTQRYFGGKLPAGVSQPARIGEVEVGPLVERCLACYGQLDLAGACDAALGVVRAVDLLIEKTQPFKLAKDPAKLPEVAGILATGAEGLRIASLLLWPVLPGKMEELWRRLGCGEYAEALKDRGRGRLGEWLRWGGLRAGAEILAGDPLFPRHMPAGEVKK